MAGHVVCGVRDLPVAAMRAFSVAGAQVLNIVRGSKALRTYIVSVENGGVSVAPT